MYANSVYLAGPIAGLSFTAATDWREAAVAALAAHGLCGITPMRDKECLQDEAVLDPLGYAAHALTTQAAITARDRFDCMRCPVTIFNFLGATRISIGTCIELGWCDAARNLGILVMEEPNPHEHAMVRGVCAFQVETLAQGIAIAVSILKPHASRQVQYAEHAPYADRGWPSE